MSSGDSWRRAAAVVQAARMTMPPELYTSMPMNNRKQHRLRGVAHQHSPNPREIPGQQLWIEEFLAAQVIGACGTGLEHYVWYKEIVQEVSPPPPLHILVLCEPDYMADQTLDDTITQSTQTTAPATEC